mgnify:FL=1|jgi:putative transposase
MSYRQLFYHIVIRPKNSEPVIVQDYEEALYRYIWGFIKDKGAVLYRIGGMPDHIHMFVSLPATLSVADFMRDLKTASNKFLQEEKEKFPHFKGWAKSYCALTYSINEKDKIVNYIKSQKEHHKKVSFRDEYLALLQANGIQIDFNYFLKD